MLIGEYEHSIDTKGRLIMPSKLKEDIGEKFVITQGLDGCLFVYSRKRMEKLRRKIKNISPPRRHCPRKNWINGYAKVVFRGE